MIVRIWLCDGEKSTMHESWPACGGSTSVGTIEADGSVEKSRSRAIGVSNAIVCREDQWGGVRVAISSSQRPSASGLIGRLNEVATLSIASAASSAHRSIQLSRSPVVGIAGPLRGTGDEASFDDNLHLLPW